MYNTYMIHTHTAECFCGCSYLIFTITNIALICSYCGFFLQT